MLIEYYSIRIKDAEPGKGSLHVTPHYDEVRSSLKHFKEKHPDKKVVAFKHELKKGPMGLSHKRKEMFGESLDESRTHVVSGHNPNTGKIYLGAGNNFTMSKDKALKMTERDAKAAAEQKSRNSKIKYAAEPHGLSEMFANRDSGSTDKENKAWEREFKKKQAMTPHKVAVTVSDPNHTMVTKRKEQIAKRVIVRAATKEEAVTKAKSFYKKKGYKVHDAEYHSRVNQSSMVTEATRSFKSLMRSIEDKKSIKNLKVPTPAERRAMEQPKQPEKPETVKESVAAPVDMGKTIHSQTHGEDTYSIHDMESPRSSSRFKVRKNGKLLANFAAHGSAHAWLKNHIESKKA